MITLSKLAVVALATAIAGTPCAAAGFFELPNPNILVDSTPKNPPHPSEPKNPPHPTTINELDDALGPMGGPAVPVGPSGPVPESKKGPVGGDSSPADAKSSAQTDFNAQIDCEVPGVESATTNDLVIENVGASDLPAGSKIRFRVPSSGDRGAFQLNRGIKAGAKLKIAGQLHGATVGAPCTVQLLP